MELGILSGGDEEEQISCWLALGTSNSNSSFVVEFCKSSPIKKEDEPTTYVLGWSNVLSLKVTSLLITTFSRSGHHKWYPFTPDA